MFRQRTELVLVDFEVSFKLRDTALKSILFVLATLSRRIGSFSVTQDALLSSLVFLLISLGSLARSDNFLERLDRLTPWLSRSLFGRLWRLCVPSKVARGRSVDLVLEGDLPRSLGRGGHIC